MKQVYKLLRFCVGLSAIALPVLAILFGLLGKDNSPHWYYNYQPYPPPAAYCANKKTGLCSL
jgi:hypothetical protein